MRAILSRRPLQFVLLLGFSDGCEIFMLPIQSPAAIVPFAAPYEERYFFHTF